MGDISFDGKVVIITGAGGGLGKQYALAFAERGAKVVVNDLGGSLKGEGGNSNAADVVVNEIKKKGGVAVANYDSVEFGDKIVKTAVDNFGTVHIIINNAGILRDSAFKNMTEKDFRLVLDVHLNGAYKLTKAAWPYFRDQKYGRIINTASPAGLYGNFGQVNYSTAKSALIGFGETLAKEGNKYNINCNIIAPLARSRMTEGLLPPDMLEKLGPDKVVPLVLYLTHDTSKVTNSIFELAAGYYGQIRWERSSGELFKVDESFTPEAILNKYKGIFEFKDKPFNKVTYPTGISDYNRLVTDGSKLGSNDQGSEKISLKDKVVIITGAGNGLGRAHALLYGKYGAKVVVNDIKDPDGVVNEIVSSGGQAIGDKHNVVSEPEAVVKTAVDAYGRVDILVNNAGILRDRSFAKISDKEWFQVLDVHVLATFKLCKLVWPIFMKQNSGVIINTTSTSGIYGNFGQSNYAAAKCSILGFTKSLAIEGGRHGIRVNAIAPHAETAMTRTIFQENEFNKFDPSQVSPFLIVLSSDKVKTTGETFEVGAGWIGNTRFQRAKGAVCHKKVVDPEFIRDHWSKVVDFSDAKPMKSAKDSLLGILQAISSTDQADDNDNENDNETKGNDDAFEYSDRDCILYNLGLGAKATELQYVYENANNFEVLPTFGVIPFMVQNDNGLNLDKLLKNFNYNFLLHGEQYLKINKLPVPTSAKLTTKSYPIAVQNKGTENVIVVGGHSTVDSNSGEEIFYNESSFFIKNSQGVDKLYKKRNSFATSSNTAPKRPPDFEIVVGTNADQASIYRLSGDYNPLHIDPSYAKAAGFPTPILHGLATFGISVKQLYEKYGKFNEVKVRFTNVVFPGEHLKVVAWKEGSRIIFKTYSVERNKVVIDNAAVHLLEEKSKL